MLNIDKYDFGILAYLKNAKAIQFLNARPISNMLNSETFEKREIKLKRSAIQKRITKLLIQKFIDEGIRTGKEKGYFLTEKGLRFFPNKKQPNKNQTQKQHCVKSEQISNNIR